MYHLSFSTHYEVFKIQKNSGVTSSSINTLSFCDHCEIIVKSFKRLNYKCRNLYKERDFLNDNLKTLSNPLAEGRKPLILIVKANIECQTLDPCELKMVESRASLFLLMELSKLTHYVDLSLKIILPKCKTKK